MPIVIDSPGGPMPLPIHGKEVTLPIDEYEFTLHFGFLRADRPTIVYTSRKPGEEISKVFISYKSLSEGFWRLAMGGETYFKGTKDYVTQTFIHFTLQDIFNKVYPTLPPPPAPAVDYYFKMLSGKMSEELEAANFTNSIFTDRMIVDPTFGELKDITETSYSPFGRSRPKFFEREDPLWNVYTQHTRGAADIALLYGSRNNSPPSSPVPKSEPNSKFSKFSRRYKELDDLKYPYLFKRFFEFLSEELGGKNGPLPDTKTTMKLFGKLVEDTFEIIGPQMFVMDTELQFPSTSNDPSSPEGFKMKVYSVPLKSRITSEVYLFMIGYYSYRGTPYKHLVNIIPASSKILANGLYSKYVSAGVYIYKPFDYQRQCSGIQNAEICTSSYVFIGKTFQQMWPLSVLEEPVIEPVAANTEPSTRKARKGGKRRYVKRTRKFRAKRKY